MHVEILGSGDGREGVDLAKHVCLQARRVFQPETFASPHAPTYVRAIVRESHRT